MLTGLTPTAALVFLPFAAAISIWVAWSDMKTMKIPNKAVVALTVVFVVLAPLLMPLKVYGLALALGVAVLVAGFLANMLSLLGAGDAKFAAAMAPFFIRGDLRFVLGLFAACVLAAFVAHRLARMVPPLRRVTEDWASWTHKDFPMGLALGGTLIFYLLAAVQPLF
jgi:prepilin peptidase CpaA